MKRTIKKILMGLMAFTFAFTLFACASSGKNEAMTASNSADPVKESASEVKDNTVSDNKDNGAEATAEDTDVLTAADEEPSGEPAQEESGEEHKTKESWCRVYVQQGKEDVTSYYPTITVEYNQKSNYVAFTMDYLGTNVYMSVDSDNLVPINGEYFILDYNEDPMNPSMELVYLEYSASQIKLYSYNETDKEFDYEYPLVFNFKEEY